MEQGKERDGKRGGGSEQRLPTTSSLYLAYLVKSLRPKPFKPSAATNSQSGLSSFHFIGRNVTGPKWGGCSARHYYGQTQLACERRIVDQMLRRTSE